jgi:hypothetical protein
MRPKTLQTHEKTPMTEFFVAPRIADAIQFVKKNVPSCGCDSIAQMHAPL